ncbi:MAG: putative toxin-antitoxin system toxin component, PIN family, partial [Deltaproteobacteria bacterium CG_4_10_14_3_um_filter_51_14]
MKIVLDTNVMISGMLNPSGPPGKIIDLLRSG